jgi:chemotaxis methyl-accepting protein methylase
MAVAAHDGVETGPDLAARGAIGAELTEMAKDIPHALRQRCLGFYLFQSRRIWSHLPASIRFSAPGRAYGTHLQTLVRAHGERKQYQSTYFLRNRAELELMCRLFSQKPAGSTIDIAVLACSKGAEVYSILWAVRSSRPDLRIRMHALDISPAIVEFAQQGVYTLNGFDSNKVEEGNGPREKSPVAKYTDLDQISSMFERMTAAEVEAMFEVEADQVKVRPWLREGIEWRSGDATDPELPVALGLQDIVLANRFLCHMEPAAADKCLRNIVRLVKPGGYLFVSGIDLDVRTKVARDMGLKPVQDLMREVHEGDPSLTGGWPLEYWGLEPFCGDRPDWRIRYASVFQIAEAGVSSNGVLGANDDRRYCPARA